MAARKAFLEAGFDRFGALCAVLLLLFACPALAESAHPLRGVALVIGEQDYAHLPKLANPGKDARDIANLLTDLGFEVDTALDTDRRKLERSLRRFVEDAADADVALLYYSGHGIEAAGNNWLVPTDADVSSLDDAGSSLVALGGFVEQLQAAVPVAIVLLDACRDDPFPPGSLLTPSPGEPAAPVAAAGLGATRGAASLARSAPGDANDSLATVLGFSAEPGHVALDGDAGSNSPYAAALLKHLSAGGVAFSDLMTMVTEEVYLKTSARQRPWVNASLRRLLYFGEAPAAPAGDEGDILTERRQLLLTIAALGDGERRQVEAAARDGGVPMDALFGMLNVLGAEAPRDPERLDGVLKAQTERLRGILAERTALANPDPEIVRLSALADRAIADGALASAIRLRERAKARVKQTASTLEQAAQQLSARFVESAAVYARSASTYEIAYDYRQAASDYGEAFKLVERWDPSLAWRYRNAQAAALNYYGQDAGDMATLEAAAEAARNAASLVSPRKSPREWATSQDNLGAALHTIALRQRDPERMRQAVEAYGAAAGQFSRETDPVAWARLESDLATAQRDLALMTHDSAALAGALDASRAAASVFDRANDPVTWAMAQSNLGNSLAAVGMRSASPLPLYEEAVAAYRGALAELTPDRNLIAWVRVQANLGDVLYRIGKSSDDPSRLREAGASFQAVVDADVRTLVPLQWAKAQAGIGNSLALIDRLAGRTAELEPAVTAFRLALEEYTRERDPRNWALTQFALGAALVALGETEKGTTRFEQAAAAFRGAADEYAARDASYELIGTQYALIDVLLAWADRETGTERLREAVDVSAAALDGIARSKWPPYYGPVLADRGNALATLARRQSQPELMGQAIDAYRTAIGTFDKGGYAPQAADTRRNLGNVLLELGIEKGSADMIREAGATFAAARDYARAKGDAGLESYLTGRIGKADAALAGR